MDSKMLWNQFISSGKIQSYIDYKNALNIENREVSAVADSNRSSCDSGDEYWRSRPTDNPFN